MLNKLGTTENMIEYHDNGKKSYEFRTDSDGFSEEITFDKHERILTIKNSNGYSCEFTRDEQGKKLAYKDSNGYYEIKRKKVTQQEYEAFIQSLEKKQTAVQFLLDELDIIDKDTLIMAKHVIWQALEKEKHQTLLGVYEGQKNHSASDEENKIMAEHWYQETFKQKK